jgi:hypothetical protein
VTSAFDLYTDRKQTAEMVQATMDAWHGRMISPVYSLMENLQDPAWKSVRIGAPRAGLLFGRDVLTEREIRTRACAGWPRCSSEGWQRARRGPREVALARLPEQIYFCAHGEGLGADT